MTRFLILLILSVAGCASPTQTVNPNLYYKRDLRIQVNTESGDGVVVAERAQVYKITGDSYGNLDLVTLTTCHREVALEDQGNHFEYNFVPINGLENLGGCGMEIGGYDKKHGRHTWGKIEFKGPDAVLQAKLTCNGSIQIRSGVSICQGFNGTEQWIEFEAPVRVSPDLRCPMPGSKDGKKFAFPLVTGECIYAFMDAQSNVHRLSTIGYQSILLREE